MNNSAEFWSGLFQFMHFWWCAVQAPETFCSRFVGVFSRIWCQCTHRKHANPLPLSCTLFVGSDDVVICYECGSTMGDWDRRDDIWIRHARQSPECQLLLAQKGPEFILSTINEFGFHDNTRVKRVHTAVSAVSAPNTYASTPPVHGIIMS